LRLSDDQGRLLWRATPDDWAAVRDQQGDTDQPIRFQGQYHDEESGLYYNRYRYYAPDLGRYVSQDPIGLLGGMNGYGYTGLNPIKYIDPIGLAPCPPGSVSPGIACYISDASGKTGYPNEGRCATGDCAAGLPRQNEALQGSLSLDIGLAGHAGIGGSTSVGISIGKKGEDYGPNVCGYINACQTAGPGVAGSVGVNGTFGNAPPSTGMTKMIGAFANGGLLGDYGGNVLIDTSNSSSVSTSVGVGLGGGTAAGVMSCQQYSYCAKD
ncbi:RHS repeat-associated core domain-containing protein, partial [Pseudomonas sp. RIT-PI-AD]|uniref:RHS repeat-associated core domain-containing protein n=1 Tax=Pseudomonas sp. RIT-PI-AD TaxID=3035294 RepID=UPI0023EF37F8